MAQGFTETDFECLIGNEWTLIGRRLRREADGLWLIDPSAIGAAQWIDDGGKTHELWVHPTATPTKPVLPFPFTLAQFKTFCEWHPTFEWEAITSVFTNDDDTADDENLAFVDSRSAAAGALARFIVGKADDEFSRAWEQHCAIDAVQTKIDEIGTLKAVTIAEIQFRDGRLKELRAELAMLNLTPNHAAGSAPVEQGQPNAPTEPANTGPTQLATTIHSTKTRRDTLTPVIEQAQKQCTDQRDTAAVWAALQVLAEKKTAPLIGATEDGLQYLKGGAAEIFTRKSLGKRLAR